MRKLHQAYYLPSMTPIATVIYESDSDDPEVESVADYRARITAQWAGLESLPGTYPFILDRSLKAYVCKRPPMPNAAGVPRIAAVGSPPTHAGEAPMSIKRPSKSTGTPVRKAAASPGVRHVDVLASRQMVPGDVCSGWLCKNKSCGLVIAIAPVPAGTKPALADSDDQLIVIKCPHCGDENLYHSSARSEHRYTAPG